MPRSFGEVLAARLAAVGLTQTAFAKQAGISLPYLQAILDNRSPMPLKRIETFADLLCPTRDVREPFILAASLTHCPPIVQAEVERLRPDLAALADGVNPPRRRRASPRRKP